MQKKLKRYFPFLLFGCLYVFIFYKVFLSGLIPFPSDLLVTFFFPYNSGGWDGFTIWVPHKEFVSSDVIRQIYPWRVLAIDIYKHLSIPLWNPYNFSGSPLLANVQSAVFYPVNIIFFFFPADIAWTIYILLQPIMAFVFMYLFVRSLKLSKFAAVLAGLAFGFIGYFRVWFELGVVGHSGLWLPLILYSLNKYYQTKNFRYILLAGLGAAFSILGGHSQTTAYVLLVSVAYIIASAIRFSKQEMRKPLFASLLFLVFGIGIAALQIFPTIELLQNSARGDVSSLALFHKFQLPLSQLITLFAPDFFGNPAIHTFWGTSYDEFMAYVGVVPLIFAFVALFQSMREFHVRFATILLVTALLFALPTPVSDLLIVLHIPVLNTGFPTRILFIVEFCLVLLSAYGLEAFLQKNKLKLLPFLFIGAIYVGILMFVLAAPKLYPHADFLQYLPIAKRNTLFPLLIAAGSFALILLGQKLPKYKSIVIVAILLIAAFDFQYAQYKYLPFAPTAYIFPQHPLVSYLQKLTPPNRVYGYFTSQVSPNLNTYWHVQSIEGYDPLYIRRYGELLYASRRQGYTKDISRSDATLEDTLAPSDSHEKQVLMNILGVKYALDKDDLAKIEKNGESLTFLKTRFNLIWQFEKWKVYQNKNVLNRAMIFYNWTLQKDDKANINTLYYSSFDYKNILTVEKPVPFAPSKMQSAPATITDYQPNKVTIKANALGNGLVYLSDNYYPGWNAYVDGHKTTILRADYSLRAVPVTKGEHTIVFKYQPLSFRIGALITFLSLAFSISLFFLLPKNKIKK